MQKRLVILSGAGISAESGIKTFRDSNGLWEGHDVQDVASPQGWEKNRDLVLKFYNDRRKQVLNCTPNQAHIDLAMLEDYFDTTIITQNVDDLHERGGSKHVIHLHGELLKVRSEQDESLVYDWTTDLHASDTNELGHLLRPHIVWFGESVPELEGSIPYVEQADVILVIGTSLQVYPAASLLDYATKQALIYYIDLKPAVTSHYAKNISIIADYATSGLARIKEELIEISQSK